MLASADEIAERVRRRVSQVSVPANKRVDLNELSKDGLIHIFSDVFGRFPSDYVVQSALNMAQDVGLTSVMSLNTVLRNEVFRKALDNAYIHETGMRMSHEDIFLIAPLIVAHGIKHGVKVAHKIGKEERRELENYWRNEVLSELPTTIDEFIDEIDSDDNRLFQIAKVLGGAKECAFCGEDIIDAEEFEQAICEYYGVEECDNKIFSALINSGIQLNDDKYPDLCSYHAHQMDKD